MGMVDKIKNIMTWESAISLMFFLACITAIGIIGIVYDNMVVYVGALVALGIPTSIMGNLSTAAATRSPLASALQKTPAAIVAAETASEPPPTPAKARI